MRNVFLLALLLMLAALPAMASVSCPSLIKAGEGEEPYMLERGALFNNTPDQGYEIPYDDSDDTGTILKWNLPMPQPDDITYYLVCYYANTDKTEQRQVDKNAHICAQSGVGKHVAAFCQ